MQTNMVTASNSPDENFFAALPVISMAISLRRDRKLDFEFEDLSQDIIVGLLIWKGKRTDREVAADEWRRIAQRATQNEILNFHTKSSLPTISLSNITEEQLIHLTKGQSLSHQPEGDRKMELHLLLKRFWVVIEKQSFLKACCLLLQNRIFVNSLLIYRGSSSSEIAKKLRLTEDELKGILIERPLPDTELAVFLDSRFGLKVTQSAIRKSRQRATDELRSVLRSEPTIDENRSSE